MFDMLLAECGSSSETARVVGDARRCREKVLGRAVNREVCQRCGRTRPTTPPEPSGRLRSGSAHEGVDDRNTHRSTREAYAEGHIPGAVSFPHREMTIESTERLDRRKVY